MKPLRNMPRVVISQLAPQGTYLKEFRYCGNRCWGLVSSEGKGETLGNQTNVVEWASTIAKLADLLINQKRTLSCRQAYELRLTISPPLGERRKNGLRLKKPR